MRSVRAKFLKDVAPLHRLGLVWCERAAPPLLLADDSREGGNLWRDCLAIVRNLTLLNNARDRSGGGGGGGGSGSASPQESPVEDAITKESMALCDNTVVLDGEGVRSALRLAAHPVNAPAKELLGLLESLVLRAARSRAAYKGTGGATTGPHVGGSSTAVAAGGASSASATATPAKKPRLNVVSPSSASPAGRGGGGSGSGGRSASVMVGASSPAATGAAGGARQ
ncbi:unnamed protein product, partial [Hapterophycus canaliculatus]